MLITCLECATVYAATLERCPFCGSSAGHLGDGTLPAGPSPDVPEGTSGPAPEGGEDA